jgi:glycosyltransferase involved in cell wall biosynthesis
MKVCHFSSVHPRFDTRIFVKECKSLSSAGHNVVLVIADGKGDFDKDGISICDVGSPKGRLSRFTKTAWKVYRKALSVDADVYHFHDPELMPFAYLLKKHGKCVIYDVHEDLPRQMLTKPYLNQQVRKVLSFLIEKTENFFAKKYDAIVTVTAHISNRFSKLNPEVCILFNYPFVNEIPDLQPWGERKNEICYVGSISKVRGVEELVGALKEIDVRLNLAGKFNSQELEVKVQSKLGWKKVNFLGFLSREEIVDVLNTSKVGMVNLHPTINYVDALPVKLFEYMLAGIPVIASNIPLWKEIVDKEKCGVVVNPFDEEEITNKISELIANDSLSEQMGKNGREAVLKKYNWELEEKKLLNLYDKLVQS